MSSSQPSRRPFPRAQEDFDQDERVSFSTLDGKYILEDDDNSEWEWDERASKWHPAVDQDLLHQQQAAYAVPGVSDDDDSADDTAAARKNKRKQDSEHNGSAKRVKSNEAAGKPERKNTAVYITNLPLDATAEEVISTFGKCGVIAEEIDSGKPRVKLYVNEDGTSKGDALVVYFRPESVQLAIQMLDDSDFRLGEVGENGRMRVKVADASYKKQKEVPKDIDVRKHARDKEKIKKKTEKMNK
jgi:HIV Tat-specific factor 1